MKYKLSFVQLANWLYILRVDLKKLRVRLDADESIPNEEMIKLLEQQKAWLLLIKDVLNRKTRLIGVQKDFLANLENLKRELGVE